MTWGGVHGHDALAARFRTALGRGRLASTFLFLGPSGVGKRAFAMQLAKCLFCARHADEELESCGACPACLQMEAGSHPDLLTVARPDDCATIPLDLLIGDREHRNRVGLCHDVALKPQHGGRRIAILDDADFLNQEGANCLLKTLEEPPPRALLILIGTSQQRQLPTILSRCQIVRFQPLGREQLARVLADQPWADGASLETLAACSGGGLERAALESNAEFRQFRDALYQDLAAARPASGQLTQLLTQHIEAAGKDAPPRRARMREVAQAAIDFYRELMRQQCRLAAGESDTVLAPEGDEAPASLVRSVEQAAAWWRGEETAVHCLERSVEASQQIDANANQSNWIEALADDLWRLSLPARRGAAPRRP